MGQDDSAIRWRRFNEWEAEQKRLHPPDPNKLRALAVDCWEIAVRVNPDWDANRIERERERFFRDAEIRIAEETGST